MKASLATLLSTVSTLGRQASAMKPIRNGKLVLQQGRTIVSLKDMMSNNNIFIRGGGGGAVEDSQNELKRSMSSETKFVKLSDPAPGSREFDYKSHIVHTINSKILF